jgi:hypothetical protein
LWFLHELETGLDRLLTLPVYVVFRRVGIGMGKGKKSRNAWTLCRGWKRLGIPESRTLKERFSVCGRCGAYLQAVFENIERMPLQEHGPADPVAPVSSLVGRRAFLLRQQLTVRSLMAFYATWR